MPIFPPIGDLASLAVYRLDNHPYVPVAVAAGRSCAVPRPSRAPVALVAISAAARAVPAVQDRLVYEVPVGDVVPSPRNPRHNLEGLDELAETIRSHGLLQPIVVRHVADGYELVAGHRRHAAVQQLGWRKVPAVVREEDAEGAYILTLVENLQREDLMPDEEAEALGVLVRERQLVSPTGG